MSRAMDCWFRLALLMPLLVGCYGPAVGGFRLPTLAPRNPAVEARSYDVHDPFPDENAGPSMYSRPRAFIQPRTDERKSYDLRYLRAAYGLQPQPQYSFQGSLVPTATAGYPVQPIWQTPATTAPIAFAPNW